MRKRWIRLPVPWRRRLLVLVGGAAGGALRELFGLVLLLEPWPWATLVANLVGSLVLGWVVARVGESTRSEVLIPLVGVGVCGALTTFGGLTEQIWSMSVAGSTGLAASYLVASLVFGLILASLGMRLGRR